MTIKHEPCPICSGLRSKIVAHATPVYDVKETPIYELKLSGYDPSEMPIKIIRESFVSGYKYTYSIKCQCGFESPMFHSAEEAMDWWKTASENRHYATKLYTWNEVDDMFSRDIIKSARHISWSERHQPLCKKPRIEMNDYWDSYQITKMFNFYPLRQYRTNEKAWIVEMISPGW